MSEPTKTNDPAKAMTWDRLLSPVRYVPGGGKVKHQLESSPVSVYQEDAGRIIHSSPFRRLQGKTQVHPFPSYDYLRTRLTHTVEVAHVGRVIAAGVAKQLTFSNEPKEEPAAKAAAADAVYAACLAHDLGNPPFGHIGEHAIQTWFERRKDEGRYAELIKTDARFGDFLNFDGNAQGFRILTRLTGWRDKGGLRLSHTTMGAFSKYPFSSREITATAKKKKFGFMHGDKKAAAKIYESLDLLPQTSQDAAAGLPKYCRHPLAYIVEAADDICYLTTDIEDANRMGLLKYKECRDLLLPIADSGGHMDNFKAIPKHKTRDRLKYLRAAAASAMIDAAIECFCERQDDLLSGGFALNLLATTNFSRNVDAIRKACADSIYKEEKKLQLEAAGFNIIMTIMDQFGDMMLRRAIDGHHTLDMREEGLYELLPEESREMLDGADPYRAMLVLVEYVSGMSDRYIRDLFQKLTGSNPSIGRMM